MSESVKSTRRYDSPRRREQAAATRRAILGAAQKLFENNGYSATTMAAIAAEAGVALKTVYIAFETKSGVLRALWHLLLRGDQDEVPMFERPWYREVVEESDPERQLRLVARNSRAVKLRAAALMKVIRDGASEDPDIAELWSRIQTDFHEIQRPIIEALRKKKALRRGLTAERASDILWALSHPDLWHLLVGERGWTADEYEQWCADASCDQLLAVRAGLATLTRAGGRRARFQSESARAPVPSRGDRARGAGPSPTDASRACRRSRAPMP